MVAKDEEEEELQNNKRTRKKSQKAAEASEAEEKKKLPQKKPEKQVVSSRVPLTSSVECLFKLFGVIFRIMTLNCFEAYAHSSQKFSNLQFFFSFRKLF